MRTTTQQIIGIFFSALIAVSIALCCVLKGRQDGIGFLYHSCLHTCYAQGRPDSFVVGQILWDHFPAGLANA